MSVSQKHKYALCLIRLMRIRPEKHTRDKTPQRSVIYENTGGARP